MKYIRQSDFEYIINKYHDTSKPFDSFVRFIRRDELFAHETGMDPDDIISGIIENDQLYKALPHPIRKARALEFVLKNTRISCDSRDIFPAINMIDRPLSKTLIKKWKNEVFGEIILCKYFANLIHSARLDYYIFNSGIVFSSAAALAACRCCRRSKNRENHNN